MKEIIKEVSNELGISEEIVEKVIGSYFYYIKRKLTQTKFKTLRSFDKVKTNFSLMGLGKLIVSPKIKKNYAKAQSKITG